MIFLAVDDSAGKVASEHARKRRTRKSPKRDADVAGIDARRFDFDPNRVFGKSCIRDVADLERFQGAEVVDLQVLSW